MMGNYELKEEERRVTFSKVGVTMMACADAPM
jgi:heat shock protein HslJ